jgi:hypothetical protein
MWANIYHIVHKRRSGFTARVHVHALDVAAADEVRSWSLRQRRRCCLFVLIAFVFRCVSNDDLDDDNNDDDAMNANEDGNDDYDNDNSNAQRLKRSRSDVATNTTTNDISTATSRSRSSSTTMMRSLLDSNVSIGDLVSVQTNELRFFPSRSLIRCCYD